MTSCILVGALTWAAIWPWLLCVVIGVVLMLAWKYLIDKPIDKKQVALLEFNDTYIAPMGAIMLTRFIRYLATDSWEEAIKMVFDLMNAPNTLEIIARDIAKPIADWYEREKNNPDNPQVK